MRQANINHIIIAITIIIIIITIIIIIGRPLGEAYLSANAIAKTCVCP